MHAARSTLHGKQHSGIRGQPNWDINLSLVLEQVRAGTCILFNNNFNLQFTKTRSDPNDRFILCDINANGKKKTLIAIYMQQTKNNLIFSEIHRSIYKIFNVSRSL